MDGTTVQPSNHLDQVDVDAYQQLLRSSTHLGDAERAGRLWGILEHRAHESKLTPLTCWLGD